MQKGAYTWPSPLGVLRRFEGNRLAKEAQAGAYQIVLPVSYRSVARTVANQVGKERGNSKLASQEGVAA